MGAIGNAGCGDMPQRVFLSHTSDLGKHTEPGSFVAAAVEAVLRARHAVAGTIEVAVRLEATPVVSTARLWANSADRDLCDVGPVEVPELRVGAMRCEDDGTVALKELDLGSRRLVVYPRPLVIVGIDIVRAALNMNAGR